MYTVEYSVSMSEQFLQSAQSDMHSCEIKKLICRDMANALFPSVEISTDEHSGITIYRLKAYTEEDVKELTDKLNLANYKIAQLKTEAIYRR
jgi:cyanate lyase